MSYAEIEMKVVQWSEARKIIPNSTPFAQSIKAVEEINELVDALRYYFSFRTSGASA